MHSVGGEKMGTFPPQVCYERNVYIAKAQIPQIPCILLTTVDKVATETSFCLKAHLSPTEQGSVR